MAFVRYFAIGESLMRLCGMYLGLAGDADVYDALGLPPAAGSSAQARLPYDKNNVAHGSA